jgi:hypothetical protein
MLFGRREVIEHPVSALEPTVRDCGFPTERQVVPREPDRHPRGPVGVALSTVQAVGMLAGFDRDARVIKPPSGHRKSFRGLRALVGRERRLEARARLLPPTQAQRRPTRIERFNDRDLIFRAHLMPRPPTARQRSQNTSMASRRQTLNHRRIRRPTAFSPLVRDL